MDKRLIDESFELLQGFRQAQGESFAEVFRLLYPALCLYSINKVGDEAVAQDIVQDAFIKVWQRRAQFEHWLSLRHYLYVTVRNMSVDFLRKQQVVRKSQAGILSLAESEKNQLQDIIRAETYSELYQAITELPNQSQTVLKLIYLEGNSTREVATKIGIDISVVRKHQKKGLSLLKNKLKPLMVIPLLISQFLC